MQLSRTHSLVVIVAMWMVFGSHSIVSAQDAKQIQTAPVVKVNQIRQLQGDKTKKDKFVIVDVRSVAETKVSVIKGAITKVKFEKEIKQHQGKAVIVYCTSGVRSASYANQLKKKGWNSWNYKGSILDWCKNELPLTTTDGKATNRVHTYSVWNRVPRKYEAVR
ncbi:rhodanese-like domain-containing protein [Mariniblastus fucicola]|uniref:Molybdopterin biosynthesis protein MoeB n=1 Tax=Mariniblastus fucicola TaxID=980251 RepID=A0A5B9PG35_9BACT|nr:rhodanese-like domain-containing protein [Mariniblastus fucicola]QEG23722.1 molybdopterin biosynthesis protein MoeB [Mariniblastus fucicola]